MRKENAGKVTEASHFKEEKFRKGAGNSDKGCREMDTQWRDKTRNYLKITI